jgi:rhodanese-related sulfurtransferase/rubrerythrin
MMADSHFRSIPEWDSDQVRRYLHEREPETFTLLDVRQPEEYDQEHIPGAKLVPLGELPDRLGELDRRVTTIVYCRSGKRAGAATGLLMNAGFDDVWNMTGGMLAWQGLKASGGPEAGAAIFDEAIDTADVVRLAWALEDGARRFYQEMSKQYADTQVGRLFEALSSAEEQHKASLRKVYAELTGSDAEPSLPEGLEPTMEGGILLETALSWAVGRPARDALELSASVEINAYDRYLQAAASRPDEASRELLLRVAREEKAHLVWLLNAFTEQLSER